MILFLGTLLLISCIIWYCFFYYLLYSIKREVNLAFAALILLVLISAGISTCPFVYYMGLVPMYEKLQEAPAQQAPA